MLDVGHTIALCAYGAPMTCCCWNGVFKISLSFLNVFIWVFVPVYLLGD